MADRAGMHLRYLLTSIFSPIPAPRRLLIDEDLRTREADRQLSNCAR